MGTIPETLGRIKALAEEGVGEWGLISIVFLLALASFGLGRLSALEEVKPPVSLREAPQTAEPQSLTMGGLVVASRSGSVYYYPWCAGATKIAAGNQVWFQSESAAQKAGYAPSKACKGLVSD